MILATKSESVFCGGGGGGAGVVTGRGRGVGRWVTGAGAGAGSAILTGLALISTNPSCTTRFSVYPPGPAS